MRILRLSTVAALTLAVGGCELVGNIFRAGIWVGAVVVLLLIVAVWFLISRVS
jgi:hypothetical protein